MLRDWDKHFPGRVESIFRALQNVSPSHLLDRHLFDFVNLRASGQLSEDGDRAFDPETFVEPTKAQVIRLMG